MANTESADIFVSSVFCSFNVLWRNGNGWLPSEGSLTFHLIARQNFPVQQHKDRSLGYYCHCMLVKQVSCTPWLFFTLIPATPISSESWRMKFQWLLSLCEDLYVNEPVITGPPRRFSFDFIQCLFFFFFSRHAVWEVSTPQCCFSAAADLPLKIPTHTQKMQNSSWMCIYLSLRIYRFVFFERQIQDRGRLWSE